MNFLNESLKNLKTVLAEGLDSQVNFDSSADGDAAAKAASSQEHENLRKLCQHQSDEVNSRNVLIIALLFLCHRCVAHDFCVDNQNKGDFRGKSCGW
jgi:hypothetical protein